jgi:hypothetical protein
MLLWQTVGIALVAAGAGAAAAWRVQDWRHGKQAAEVQAHIATAREGALHAALVSQSTAARAALERADRARRDAAAAGAAADGLRRDAAAVAARCNAEGSDPASSPGAVLADVLGRLESAGRELADYADRARIAGQQCDEVTQ